jgi:hypothetical protein
VRLSSCVENARARAHVEAVKGLIKSLHVAHERRADALHELGWLSAAEEAELLELWAQQTAEERQSVTTGLGVRRQKLGELLVGLDRLQATRCVAISDRGCALSLDRSKIDGLKDGLKKSKSAIGAQLTKLTANLDAMLDGLPDLEREVAGLLGLEHLDTDGAQLLLGMDAAPEHGRRRGRCWPAQARLLQGPIASPGRPLWPRGRSHAVGEEIRASLRAQCAPRWAGSGRWSSGSRADYKKLSSLRERCNKRIDAIRAKIKTFDKAAAELHALRLARGEVEGRAPSATALGNVLLRDIDQAFWLDPYLFREVPAWLAPGKQGKILALHARRRADEEIQRLGWEAQRATGWAIQEADHMMAILAELDGAFRARVGRPLLTGRSRSGPRRWACARAGGRDAPCAECCRARRPQGTRGAQGSDQALDPLCGKIPNRP